MVEGKSGDWNHFFFSFLKKLSMIGTLKLEMGSRSHEVH